MGHTSYSDKEAGPVEAMTMFLIAIVGLAVLGAASILWGADSRDHIPDDHTR